MTTIKELARLAGVSQATVSRVLNGNTRVHPDTRNRVMELARELNFQPNANARTLVSTRSRLLGLVVPDSSNPFFPDIIRAALLHADQHGYGVIVCDTQDNEHVERNHLAQLRGRQVDGILLVPVRSDAPSVASLASQGTPVVIITQDIPRFDYVAVDHATAGAMVAKHLLDLGHTEIGYLGPIDCSKREGFEAGLVQGGSSLPPEHQIECRGVWAEFLYDEAYRRVQECIASGRLNVTALFACSDVAALGAVRALEEAGLQVGADVAVVGFDNTQLAANTRPGLTSVAQPTMEIGRLATEILLKRISGERGEPMQVFLPPRLIVRASSTGVALSAPGGGVRRS